MNMVVILLISKEKCIKIKKKPMLSKCSVHWSPITQTSNIPNVFNPDALPGKSYNYQSWCV